MTETFGARVRRALDERGPLCVGLDPHRGLLEAWGLSGDAKGLEQFSMTVVDALADRVAVIKPQSAFFERMGSAGIAVLERVLAAARAAGAITLLDVKRGDIGSTMEAYAAAYLDPTSTLFADAITVSPYLGFGSLQPLIDTALAHGAGVFVLGLTSNPEGAEIQQATAADGRSVAQNVVDAIAMHNAGAAPLGSVGVVIGATLSHIREDISSLNGPILAPGLGAQGWRPADLPSLFGSAIANVIPATSRDILASGPTIAGLRERAATTVEACRAALTFS